MVARHAFIDDVVTRFPEAQLVLVGAGFDTRPWRMPRDRCWVVDHPATLMRRAQLGPAGDGRQVALDLGTDSLADALSTHGHQAEEPTVWVWEGVSMYLGQASVQHTLQVLAGRSARGSQLLMDFWHSVDGDGWNASASRVAALSLQAIGEPIRYGLHPADVQAVLGQHGWSVVGHGTAGRLREQFGRRCDPSMHVVHAQWDGEGR